MRFEISTNLPLRFSDKCFERSCFALRDGNVSLLKPATLMKRAQAAQGPVSTLFEAPHTFYIPMSQPQGGYNTVVWWLLLLDKQSSKF